MHKFLILISVLILGAVAHAQSSEQQTLDRTLAAQPLKSLPTGSVITLPAGFAVEANTSETQIAEYGNGFFTCEIAHDSNPGRRVSRNGVRLLITQVKETFDASRNAAEFILVGQWSSSAITNVSCKARRCNQADCIVIDDFANSLHSQSNATLVIPPSQDFQ